MITLNGRTFTREAEPDTTGTYRIEPNGVVLFDIEGNPRAFLVSNIWKERFIVSCHRIDGIPRGGIRFMHGLSSIEADWLGLSDLSYAAMIDAVTEALAQVGK